MSAHDAAPNGWTIARARDALRAGKISAVELTEDCLRAIEGAGALNAFVRTTPDMALDQARAADARIRAGDAAPLTGIPVGVKDLFCTRGVATEAGSRILEGFVPDYESAVTERLTAAGAVMLGKLNLDEFAMGSTTETSAAGPAINPWRARESDEFLVPGGSSGGSAAAVAADLCLGAIGSDTGGSIRQPAAFTGITGLKPTYGRVSRRGMIALASSLDQAGPMTRSVRDAALMLQAIAGDDPGDATCAPREVPDYEAALVGDIRGRVIGIPREQHLDGLADEIEALWQRGIDLLRERGAIIRDISLPHSRHALATYHAISPAEASSNLARYDGIRFGLRVAPGAGGDIDELYEKTRARGLGHEVQRRILLGTHLLSAECYERHYNRARRVRRLIHDDFARVYESGVDAILTPTTPSAAFPLGRLDAPDPIDLYRNDIFTVIVNLAGLPAIALPVMLNDAGLPLGLQLIGRPWDEAGLLDVALALEEAAAFTARPDAWWLKGEGAANGRAE